MNQTDNSILKNTGIMTIATLLSRVSGLARTWIMALALGNTIVTSAYVLANGVPNAIYDLVTGGILGAAFLPVYLLQREKRGKAEGDRFASNILNILLVTLGIITILSTFFAPQVIFSQSFTVPATAEVRELATHFFRIFAIQIMFYGLGGTVTGILNANRVYGMPALAPVLNNIIIIISFVAYMLLSQSDGELAIIVLAVGTSLGVVAQFGIQIPALIKIGFTYTFRINLRDPALKEVLRIALPTFIYIIGTIVSYSARNAFSLQGSDVGTSTLNYAWMWYQLPYGVIAVSLSTTMLTEMSNAVARSDFDSLRDYIKRGLRGTLFLIIPLAGMMFVLASPIIQLFKAGAFTQDAVVEVSSLLAFWVLSLPFYAGQMYLYRVFAALRQFMVFALVSCALCVIQIGLYALLCSPDMLGIIGVPVADFVYFGLQFFVMSFILRKRVGSFGFFGIVGMSLKALIATAVGMIFAWLPIHFFFSSLEPSIPTGFAQIIVCGLLGLAVTFALCKILRIPEMQLAGSIFKRITNKTAPHTPLQQQQPSNVSPAQSKQHGSKHAKQEKEIKNESFDSQNLIDPTMLGKHVKRCENGVAVMSQRDPNTAKKGKHAR